MNSTGRNTSLIGAAIVCGSLCLGMTFSCFVMHPTLRWIYAMLSLGIGSLIVAQLASQKVRVVPTKYAAVGLVCCLFACIGSFFAKSVRDERRQQYTQLVKSAQNAHDAGDVDKAFTEIEKANGSWYADVADVRAGELLEEYRKPYDEKRVHIEKEKQAVAAQAQAEEKELLRRFGPKPEKSNWDGSVRAVTEYAEQNFNDPDVEFLEWSEVFYTEKPPSWAVRVKFRAKNGFGARMLQTKVFFIRDERVTSIVDR